MLVIVGLGNPGAKYENTHHNAGFIAVDYMAEKLGVTFSDEKKFQALVGKTTIAGEDVLFVKPQTYMNLSGLAVGKLIRYYKVVPQDTFIIYDDIEIPLGTLRVRKNGSGGTHNGMKNIIQEVGTQDIPRIRIGLGVDKSMNLADYVLSPISNNDMVIVKKACEKIDAAMHNYVKNYDFERLMQSCNGKVE